MLIIYKKLALYAEKFLRLANTASNKLAVKLVLGNCEAKKVKVKWIKPLAEKEDVYNMTVLHNHNYSVEGGMIIKNCDALRYSHTVTMRGANNGKVYEKFTSENITENEMPMDTVYLGTLALPGKILWISAFVSRGKIKVIDAFSQGVIDFKQVAEKYPKCECVWTPLEKLSDVQQNYVSDCVEADIEPAVPGVLPAEGEGTKLVNDLFERNSLQVMEGAWTLISCLNERVFLSDGKIERSSKEQENARFCRLFEYLVWRIVGRLQVDE